MLALTVAPGTKGSARLDEVAEPDPARGEILIAAHSVGICGTDREIIDGLHGAAPPGGDRLILGHESLGRVLEVPAGRDLAIGDWVAGIVRHPDPVPCASCAHGEWDMCANGRYLEHGIKGLDGFAAERYRLDAGFVVKVDPDLAERGVLIEPASVVAKAWDQIDRIGRRAFWAPSRVLVIGAGPIGLLAALLGVQRGLEVHVLDRHTEGPKPGIVRDLGATYHSGSVEEAGSADIILECTGAPALIVEALHAARPNGIVCLTGVSAPGKKMPVDTGALNRELVLENNVVFGSVNANRAHYDQGALALRRADPRWLDRLITRRVPLADWATALEHRPDDVKTVLRFGDL
ncbi:MAG: glucose 1-dehydrogenase [Deltaproteobacteria bacterium]|nr:glucose 1-dehydrogenase [Deltaproteobacteria bacterium]